MSGYGRYQVRPAAEVGFIYSAFIKLLNMTGLINIDIATRSAAPLRMRSHTLANGNVADGRSHSAGRHCSPR